MENELPEGWELIEIDEYFDQVKDKIEPTENTSLSYIGLEHLAKGGGIDSTGNSDDLKSTKSVFQKGDVLYGKLRPYLNKHAFVDFDGVCSTDILVFRAENLYSAKYLNYYLGTSQVIGYANENSQGINLPRVSGKIMGYLNIPLPPLAEQTRIVAKLDAAFGHLETLKTSLARIPELLKKFRQTVLTQAVMGKLTEVWREENFTKTLQFEIEKYILSNKILAKEYKSELRFKTEKNPWGELPQIPDTWTWATASEIVDKDADIVYGIVQPGPKLEIGIPYVRGTDIQDGKILVNQLLKTSPEIAKRYERASLKMNDILLGIIRSTKVAKVPSELEGGNITQGTARLRPSNFIICDYMQIWLLSEKIQNWLHSHYRGIDMPGLNLKDVRKVPFAIPPLEEQQEIVNRVEALFAQADALEAQYQSLKVKIDKLPQALLAKAFRGELVPQDPTDEPASVLLEKIKAATAAVGKKKAKAGQTSLAFMEE